MKNILRLLAGGFAAAFFSLAAQAANLAPGAFSAGTVKGDVSYKLAGSAQYQPLAAGVALPQGAIIKTGANSSVLIVFGSGSTATLDANSEVEVTKFLQDVFSGPVPVNAEPSVSETQIRIIDGGITAKVAKLKKGSSFNVNSPVGAAGVRGTVFKYAYSSARGEATLQVTEGGVLFVEKGGKTTLAEAGKKVKVTFTKDAEGNVTSATLDLSDLTAAEAAAVSAVVGGTVTEAGGTVTTVTPTTVVITPVDVSQVSSE